MYLYGSHDRTNSDYFCDYKLKVWSASISNLNHWQCHGHSFHTRDDRDHKADTDWTSNELYAPDVIEKDGKYYLYAYIFNSKGCVGVSDQPEGPFQLLSKYQYSSEQAGDDGIYNDSGVLVDDDEKVYIYYGFEKNYMNEINPENMFEILDGSLKADVLGQEEPHRFFEASSPRKINDTYYLIYSPRVGSDWPMQLQNHQPDLLNIGAILLTTAKIIRAGIIMVHFVILMGIGGFSIIV